MFGQRYIKSDPNTCLMLCRKGKLKQAAKGLSFWYFSPVSAFLTAIPTWIDEQIHRHNTLAQARFVIGSQGLAFDDYLAEDRLW
jgi:hypothetical protein